MDGVDATQRSVGVSRVSGMVVFDSINSPTNHKFSLSHPKNYFGVVVAAADNRPMELLLPELSSMSREGCVGAEALGLLNRDRSLTQAGELFVREVTRSREVGDVFGDLANSTRSRLCDIDYLSRGVQQTVARYPPAVEVINILDSTGQITLSTLGEIASENGGLLADYLFNDNPQPSTVDDTESYHANVTYQFKSILFHSGIITTPGSDTTQLDPPEDVWSLSPKLDNDVKRSVLAADNRGEWV